MSIIHQSKPNSNPNTLWLGSDASITIVPSNFPLWFGITKIVMPTPPYQKLWRLPTYGDNGNALNNSSFEIFHDEKTLADQICFPNISNLDLQIHMFCVHPINTIIYISYFYLITLLILTYTKTAMFCAKSIVSLMKLITSSTG